VAKFFLVIMYKAWLSEVLKKTNEINVLT